MTVFYDLLKILVYVWFIVVMVWDTRNLLEFERWKRRVEALERQEKTRQEFVAQLRRGRLS